MFIERIDVIRNTCRSALLRDELRSVDRAIERAGISDAELLSLASQVSAARPGEDRAAQLRNRLVGGETKANIDDLGRVWLVRSARAALELLERQPIADSVKALLCDEFESWTSPDLPAEEFRAGSSGFVDRCMFVSFRRFPAGQFDWVRGGVPWSYLLGVKFHQLPKTLFVTAARLGGRAPIFFTHNGYRRLGASFSEPEGHRAYYRMAKSMELQPDVKGMVGASWFRSPDTHRVSPRLAWVNAVVLAHGGSVAVLRQPNPNSGVLTRSPTRRRLYEKGEFIPTIGLVMWPRKAMLAWAAAHPELE